MCGVFYVDDDTMREIEKIARKIDQKSAATGDVHPSHPALILRAAHGKMVSEVLKWGYEAYWKKTLIFNARSETVQERPMFRRDFEERRCLIPAGKFYEWKQDGTKQKKKYEFFTPDKILYLAGIYHKDPEGDRFTILTREADGSVMGAPPPRLRWSAPPAPAASRCPAPYPPPAPPAGSWPPRPRRRSGR